MHISVFVRQTVGFGRFNTLEYSPLIFYFFGREEKVITMGKRSCLKSRDLLRRISRHSSPSQE